MRNLAKQVLVPTAHPFREQITDQYCQYCATFNTSEPLMTERLIGCAVDRPGCVVVAVSPSVVYNTRQTTIYFVADIGATAGGDTQRVLCSMNPYNSLVFTGVVNDRSMREKIAAETAWWPWLVIRDQLLCVVTCQDVFEIMIES